MHTLDYDRERYEKMYTVNQVANSANWTTLFKNPSTTVIYLLERLMKNENHLNQAFLM